MNQDEVKDNFWQSLKRLPITKPVLAEIICRALTFFTFSALFFLFDLGNSDLKDRVVKIGICCLLAIGVSYLAKMNWVRWAERDSKEQSN